MSQRIPKISPPAQKTMAVPLKAQPALRPSLNKTINHVGAKPSTPSGVRKNKAGRASLPKAEFSSAALKRSLVLLFPFSIFLFLGLFLIWERVKVREFATQIAKLESQRNQLVDQNGKLRIQLEQLSGYGRISRIATQRLGLVAVPQQTILVEEE